MKTCFKCQQTLPAEGFYRHPQMADGRLNKCKECTKKDVGEYRQNNIDYIRRYDAARFRDPRRKAKVKEYFARMRDRHPQKFKARNMVNNAIRDGILIRQPCQVCGNRESQAHHPDYSRPLDVQWLCFKHHREAHGQQVAA